MKSFRGWTTFGITIAAAIALASAVPRAALAVCGDGTVDEGEACDDGNTNDYDACHNSCTTNLCGNNALDGGEECDDGGLCVGGDNAGKRCPASVQDGVDCGAGNFCQAYGGDNCAANCIEETRRTYLYSDESFSQVQAAAIGLKFPIRGQQVLTTSKHPDANGNYAVVVKAEDVQILPIPVSGLSLCACVRGQAVKTCGGGPTGRQCTLDETICDGRGEGPCLFVHGSGNAASGTIGCGPNGLSPINVDLGRDHNTRFGNPEDDCSDPGEAIDDNLRHEPGACNGATVVTTTGEGPPGSALFLNSLNIQTIPDGGRCNTEVNTKICVGGAQAGTNCTASPALCGEGGTCERAKGPNGIPCDGDDPITALTATVPIITGIASAQIFNANNDPSQYLGPDAICGANTCVASVQGTPFSCSALEANPTGGVGGVSLGSAFPAFDNASLGDLLVSTLLASAPDVEEATPTPTTPIGPTPTPTVPAAACIGDCGNDESVTVDELVMGVNIALGNASIDTCPEFDENDDDNVTVDELVKGVNNALNGCA
jgi:cysteine-rich repeat protein